MLATTLALPGTLHHAARAGWLRYSLAAGDAAASLQLQPGKGGEGGWGGWVEIEYSQQIRELPDVEELPAAGGD